MGSTQAACSFLYVSDSVISVCQYRFTDHTDPQTHRNYRSTDPPTIPTQRLTDPPYLCYYCPMPKTSSVYVCQQCGYQSPTFMGRCPECGTWNSLVEQIQKSERRKTRNDSTQKSEIINLQQLDKQDYQRISTKIEELDRVLGGGIVAGSVVLVAGDPGIGKSTLLTQLALNMNSSHDSRDTKNNTNDVLRATSNVLYVAGEESAKQIKIRADRISPKADLAILNEVDVDVIAGVIEEFKPSLAIIDSIQTLQTDDLNSVAGSVGQVRESAHRLQKLAKKLHIPIFLVGHVTKEGTIAGPKTLEHLVDVVLSLEGDSSSPTRILRATKNRFGATDEIGVFEMVDQGIKEIKNPSQFFLEQKVDAPGSVVVALLNGVRPLLVEIQALVTKSYLPVPRRTGFGVDINRLQLLVAVLSKRLNLPLGDKDVFVNVTGGVKINEPAVDLGVCMAIISSLKDQSIKPKSCFIGEVGLLGELRAVRGTDKRSNEAKKLGYTNIISPENAKSLDAALKLSIVSAK